MRIFLLPLVVALGLIGCTPNGTKAPTRADLGAEAIGSKLGAAPKAKPGECWASDTSPAIIETVTEQKIVTPESRNEAGNIVQLATYFTTTRQEMVRERAEIWFRAPCPEEQTSEFIATLQRALKARGYFLLPLTAEMDPATNEALRRFQSERGLDSAILSLAAAQELGLITTALEDL
jgi:hypothetical protein